MIACSLPVREAPRRGSVREVTLSGPFAGATPWEMGDRLFDLALLMQHRAEVECAVKSQGYFFSTAGAQSFLQDHSRVFRRRGNT